MRYVIFSLCFLGALQAKHLSVQVSAPSAVLINADTGAVLYEKESHLRHLPASITKIATALYVLERKGDRLDEIVEASQHALATVHASVRLAPGSKHPPYRLEHDGTRAGIVVGENLTLASLLYGLMLSSGNDAANILAESVSGTVDGFCEELNQFLKENGIENTQFVNPHGLHHDQHWTTAHDMAQITRLALKHPMFRQVVKTTRYLLPQTNRQPPRYFVQHNRLLMQGACYYPKAIGVKTGYHSRAGFTMVGAATHEGRTLIAVVLKCRENMDRFRDVVKLFDAAFAEKKVVRTLYAKESDLFTHRIKGADGPLNAVLKEDAILEYYPAEEPNFRAEIAWLARDLPLEAGEQVGILRCIDDKGNILLEKSIFATHPLSRTVLSKAALFCKAHKSIMLGLFFGAQVILLLVYYFKKYQKLRQR